MNIMPLAGQLPPQKTALRLAVVAFYEKDGKWERSREFGFDVTVGTLQAALGFNNGDGVLLPQVCPQDVGVAAALVPELRRLFPAGVSGGKQTRS